jgi:2-polyprenyl-3-methyl-5-hydroxy-6-metoxy-1,4-benzoquinol methylase
VTTEGALFDPLAELYERYAEINDGVYRPWLTGAVAAAGTGGPRARAVDLGCGTGRFEGLLADRYGSVLAVDISARELEIARTRHARDTVTYEQRGLLDVTPATDGRFDLVVSVNTIFHLRDHDRVLPHVRDLVAPGGWAVLVDIVSPPGGLARTPLMHRWYGVGDAARTLRRRRSLPDAWMVFRLRQHKVWMQHAATNRPLTRDGFHAAYGAVFPGCEFTDSIDPFVCAIRWQKPAAPAAG